VSRGPLRRAITVLGSPFGPDRWAEIFETLRRNRMRTALTALSVAWGIFMLVLLLGAGAGLRKGTEANFGAEAQGSIWVWAGQTSVPHQGTNPGRQILLRNADLEAIRDRVDRVQAISGRFFMGGGQTVSYGEKRSSFNLRAVHPDFEEVARLDLLEGRFLNDLDLRERRKVVVIGAEVARFLFPSEIDPIGERIAIGDILYKVVGICDEADGEGELRSIYVPITTAQIAYGGSDRIHNLMLKVGRVSVEESRAIEEEIRALLATQHRFAPSDRRAVHVRSNIESYQRMMRMLDAIAIFIWIVGAGTVVAGIVGVSNIMLISVKERTREIGIRKALGATPGSIIALIMQESILITTIAGYVGLVAGVGAVELAAATMPASDYFRDPEIEFGAALGAMGLLIVFGALAGYFPARRAARVNPIVALRDES
jgi:putative ABC transport system permease protein